MKNGDITRAGKENLAEEIEWVSQTQGDGLGFDILSRNTNGTDKYVEIEKNKINQERHFTFPNLNTIFLNAIGRISFYTEYSI